jgi:hypothetical protein
LEIQALHSIFYEAYYRLVLYIARSRSLTDASVPSNQDVCQAVFFSLHRTFSKGASIQVSLATYISTVASNECSRQIKDHVRRSKPREWDTATMLHSPGLIIPPGVVRMWEHLDWRLTNSKLGNLINRIILADQSMEGFSTWDDHKISAKELKDVWQPLLRISDDDMAALHQRVTQYFEQSSSQGAVALTAEVIDRELAEPVQVSLVFAWATGVALDRTRELLEKLNALSDSDIFTRICRIRTLLRPPRRMK